MVFPFQVVLLALLPTIHRTEDTSDQCTVVEGKDFIKSINVDALSYITSDSPLNITLKYEDCDFFECRDVLQMNNHLIKHFMTRSKHINSTSYTLPLVIPEGWNRLKVNIDKDLTLQWNNENNEVSLLNLTLDLPLANIFIRGNFSVCSGDSPEWDVNDDSVTIQLQPLKKKQLLEVSGNDILIVDHMTTPGFANTILDIETWRRDFSCTINIKEKDASDQGVNKTLETPRPHITVKSVGGSTRLRLDLSDGDACENVSNMASSNFFISFSIPLMCGCFIALALR